MESFRLILLIFLVLCAVFVTFSRNLLVSVVIFMSYSLVMSMIWVLLESPDLAITEAAVGAGVTSVLFFMTLKKNSGHRKRTRLGEGSCNKRNQCTSRCEAL